MRFVVLHLTLCLAWFGLPAMAEPSARLIHFTDDGTELGTPLLPGFPLHSVWSGMGQTNDGTVYIAVSNHAEPGGNVAIFKFEPQRDKMTFVADLKSISEAADNWLPNENQYKVHTFLVEHLDGNLYFATMPADKPSTHRGAHLYRLDPRTDTISDLSATAPFFVDKEGKVRPNERATGGPGGILVQGQGIKGLMAHPTNADVLLMMTHDNGDLFAYSLSKGTFAPFGLSPRVAYVFHVDPAGDVYYLGPGPNEKQSILRYDVSTGETTPVLNDIPLKEEVGMIAPTANPDVVMVLLARSKRVIPLNTAEDRILRGGKSCGKNFWQLHNMTVSPDGRFAYFVSNNNDDAKRVMRVPVNGGKCSIVIQAQELLGTRNLAFGGQNIWWENRFYTPVWTHQGSNDLAILEVTVD